MRLQSFLEAASECVLSKSFLKNFAIFTGKHLCCKAIFYKATGFQHTRIQHRCFIVNNTKFLRKYLGKNILKTNSQKLLNKYKNTFICTLHVVMKKKTKKKLKCLITNFHVFMRKPVLQTQSNSYRVMNLTSVKITDMKSTPI